MDRIILNTATEKLAALQVEATQRQADALERIANKLEQLTTPAPTDETVLREAESLPLDIPGREALEAAGYTSANQLPKSGKDLERIKGIGRVTANQVLTYLKIR